MAVRFSSVCRKLMVLTGAGVSTESAVPDYRGPQGAYTTGFKPMTHQQVIAFPRGIYRISYHSTESA